MGKNKGLKMNLESRIKKLVLENNFSELEKLLGDATVEKIDDILSKIAFDNESVVMYTTACMLLIKKETAELHYIAAQLLMHPLCHFEGAYAAALYHVRKAIELDPDDIELKEVLVFLHGVPDKVVS